MKKTKRTIPTKRPYRTTAIILIAVAIALFLLKNSILDNKKDSSTETSRVQTDSSRTPVPPAGQPTGSPAPAVTPPPNAGEPSPPPPPLAGELSPTEDPCQKVATDLTQFFAHLDKQEYIKAYSLNEPIHSYLNALITKILRNPPVNEKETADLMTVIKNASHFYRTLGPKDLAMVKDILTFEHDSLEAQLASLYAWSRQGDACRHNSPLTVQLPLAQSYEYAAYFLNTLGGQSYLSRRDSTVRVLAKYYSVLIVQQAAQHSLNRYHINLPYHLDAVIKEITNSDFLANQDLYLDTLQKIKVGP